MIEKKTIQTGLLVDVSVFDEKSNETVVRGFVSEILTREAGAKKVKVKLSNGVVGVVNHIVSKEELKRENFKFYNLFFYEKVLYSIWDNKSRSYYILNRKSKLTSENEKIAFLFNDKVTAMNLVKKIGIDNLSVREINRKKAIVDNFKTLKVEYFSINTTRKIDIETFEKWERHFKSV